MKNKILRIFLMVMIMVNLLMVVSSLGITPARTTMDFKPGAESEISFSVINSEHKDSKIVIYSQGELNSSILLKENSFSMSASEDSKQLTYKVKLPQELSPGTHTVDIVALQLPGGSDSGLTMIGTALAVVTQLYVYVPYTGKYVEADLNVVNADQNSDVVLIAPVINKGNVDVARLKVNYDIYNKLNEKVASFNSEEIGLKINEKRDLITNWKANVPVGVYRVVATVIYDEKTINIERSFNIGSAVLDLQQVDVKDFTLGEIGKFEMLIENKWSEPIKGAYVQTNVLDSNGGVMADFKSPTYDIEPLKKVIMVSYWDTAGVKEGTYDAKIFLKYADKSAQKDVKFKISENKIETIGLGYVISESTSGKKESGSSALVTMLIVVVVILVLLNFVWFMILRKYLLKRGDKKNPPR